MLGSSSVVVVVVSALTCFGLWYLSLLLSPEELIVQASQGPHSDHTSITLQPSQTLYSPNIEFIADLVESGLTQQSSFWWKYAANCLQLLLPQTWTENSRQTDQERDFGFGLWLVRYGYQVIFTVAIVFTISLAQSTWCSRGATNAYIKTNIKQYQQQTTKISKAWLHNP